MLSYSDVHKEVVVFDLWSFTAASTILSSRVTTRLSKVGLQLIDYRGTFLPIFGKNMEIGFDLSFQFSIPSWSLIQAQTRSDLA